MLNVLDLVQLQNFRDPAFTGNETQFSADMEEFGTEQRIRVYGNVVAT